MRIKIVTAPAVEPVTVAEVKTALRISHDAEDSLISGWITAAREIAEVYQRRTYVNTTYDLSFDRFPGSPFELPRSPLVSVTSVKYYDSDNVEYTVATADYFVDTTGDPGRIDLTYGTLWPAVVLRSTQAVVVRFVAGMGATAAAVPQRVKDAILLYCGYRDDNRAGEITKIPEAFYSLLRPNRMV